MSDFKLPIDFETKMKTLLQDEWEDFIDCYENHKYQALRVNALKVLGEDKEAILKKLGMAEITPVPWAKNGYYYEQDLRPGKHVYHEMGLYYIQEPSAMSAAGLLGVTPGDVVLDLCSAPGGKATQLAAFLQGDGLLVANEIHPARCKILSQNIERMGIGNAIVTNEDPAGLAAHFPVFFDKILVDAPCSGEGMFRKNPEAMEEWSLEQVKICADRQADILQSAAVMLKPGGRLVYSTCTFAPEEDEMSIANFLETHPDFEIEEVEAPYFSTARADWANSENSNSIEKTFRLWPHKLHGEGHYVAVLKKCTPCTMSKAENFLSKDKKKNKKGKGGKAGNADSGVLNKEQKQALQEFYDDTLHKSMSEQLALANLILFGDNLYALPQGIASISGLKVERPGLQIGTFKKGRFEPSHALALYLKKQDVQNAVDLSLDDNRVAGYFRGEGFYIEDTAVSKGYCLVCVDGYPAGWGKLVNGQVKNHYPKGLRKEL